ncbi:hypothetical protein S245_012232, partial [Arachis hypogaea]
WSKIAQYLPGRTDNEIKNYWRTRVQKHAKQLKCDVNSKQFKDTMRFLWMPRLVERIQAAAATVTTAATAAPNSPTLSATKSVTIINNNNTTTAYNFDNLNNKNNLEVHGGNIMNMSNNNFGYATPSENSSTGTSSDSFVTQDCYNNNNNVHVGNNNNDPSSDYYHQQGNNNNQVSFMDCITSPSSMSLFPHQEMDFQAMELPNTPWINNPSTFSNFWNDENMLLLQNLGCGGDNM